VCRDLLISVVPESTEEEATPCRDKRRLKGLLSSPAIPFLCARDDSLSGTWIEDETTRRTRRRESHLVKDDMNKS